MKFTVYGEHPEGHAHSEFMIETAVGAIKKAVTLMGQGWTGVCIYDENGEIYRPDRFHELL